VFASLKDLTLDSVELAAGSPPSCSPLIVGVLPNLAESKLRMICVDFKRTGTTMLVLDAGELLEVSMSFIDEMHLLEMRTSKLLFLGITGCEDLVSRSGSRPRDSKRSLIAIPQPSSMTLCCACGA